MIGGRTMRADGVAGGIRGRPDLFARIGGFLSANGLSPDPAHYAFAHRVLSDPDGALAGEVARLTDGGVRLGRQDIERLGGSVTPGPPPAAAGDTPAPDPRPDARVQAQAETLSALARTVRDETREFGRDLAEQAERMTRAVPDANGMPGLSEAARIAGAMIARAHQAEDRLATAVREAEGLRAMLRAAENSARRDPLTGLPNRRAFSERFDEARPGRRWVALGDVDRFKAINDRFGHGLGDRVLCAIGQALDGACPNQFVARHGGEEFAILLTGVDEEEAVRLLEDARAVVSAKRFRSRDDGSPVGRVTLSVGLTEVAPGEPLDEALARADRHLYAAKSGGRDRLYCDPGPARSAP